MMDVQAFYDMGHGAVMAKFADGREYIFRPTGTDKAPMHVELCAVFATGEPPLQPRPPRDAAEVKRFLLAMVDEQAARRRGGLDVNKAATHAAKLEEARALLELVTHDGPEALTAMTEADRTATYPLLSASLSLHGNTLLECAQTVHEAAMKSRQLAYDVERVRLHTRAAITAAATADDAERAFTATQWTT